MSASVLLLGYSSIASRRVIPALQALCADRPIDIASRTKVMAPDHHGAVYSDYDTALANSTADVVYVSLPNALHFEVADKALHSGRHVIIDKPAFVTIQQAETLLDRAAKSGRLLAEATVFNYHRQFGEIAGFLEQYGPLECVTAQFIIPPLPIENFRNHRELGGGCFLDMGPYAAALARLFFAGADLSAFALQGGVHPQTGVDTGFSILVGIRGGPSLTGHFSFQGEYQNQLCVTASAGSFATQRVFSLPRDTAPEWILRVRNKDDKRVLPKDDAFESFFRAAFGAIAKRNYASLASDLLQDARFRHVLSERMATR